MAWRSGEVIGAAAGWGIPENPLIAVGRTTAGLISQVAQNQSEAERARKLHEQSMPEQPRRCARARASVSPLSRHSSAPNGTECMPISSVPIIPPHEPDDMILAIEALRERAEADGNGTLAYLLDIARIEAEAVSNRARAAEEERKAGPDDLWRPG
jgi:hypothetical protein